MCSPGTASISGGRERGLPLSFTTHGITGSPRGLTPTRASVPEFFTTSLEESGSLPPPSKMLEPCKGTSLEMKCSTISDCVTRSPGTQPGSLFHALLPRRSWAPHPPAGAPELLITSESPSSSAQKAAGLQKGCSSASLVASCTV